MDQVQWHSKVVGYDIAYRYHGRRYYTRLPHGPGRLRWVTVDVAPMIREVAATAHPV